MCPERLHCRERHFGGNNQINLFCRLRFLDEKNPAVRPGRLFVAIINSETKILSGLAIDCILDMTERGRLFTK
jgi:hypothetical protein